MEIDSREELLNYKMEVKRKDSFISSKRISCAKDTYLLTSKTGEFFMGSKMSEVNKYARVCPVCGKEFTTSNYRRIYCCSNCKAAFYRDKHRIKHEKVCPICGKKFFVNRSIDVYCSRDCYEKSKIIYRNEHKIIKEEIVKICPVCEKEFTTKVHNKLYCSSKCKGAAYRSSHREREKERSRIYYSKNKEVYKKWEERNREKRLTQKREYYKSHKEEKKEYARINKERIRVNKRALHHKKKQDPMYRLIRKCRDFVHRCLESPKLHKTQVILGYTPEELKKYLESNFYGNMNWDVRNWEIHHIKPLDMFNFLNEDGTDNYEAIKEANKLSNLFPLFVEDHKKLTNLYNSENRWLSKEEIKEFIADND